MTRGTTICCSALALITLISAARKPEPMALVPARTVWALALNNQLVAPPAYDERQAYFSIEHDRLVAYDMLSGAQRWLVDARPLFEPAAGQSLVFITEPEGLVARHAADGSVAWRVPLGEPPAARPVWDNGWIVVPARSAVIRAFRGTDGELIWERDLGSPAHAPPALAADRVYVSTDDGRVVALSIKTGEPLWERRVGGSPNEILAVEDRLYVGSTDTFLYCLMARDGRIDWRWRTGGNVIWQPVAHDGHVYFASFDNVLRSLGGASGGQQWMRGLPMRPTSGPVQAGATLVVTGVNPPVHSYNIKDGAPGADLQVEGEIAAPLHALVQPETGLPLLLVVTRDLVKGATATLFVRSVDPPASEVAPLPNPVMPAPKLPSPP